MAPKAIETRYKGYRFRSRLEARWAVFFDTAGIDYEYEKEGFDLDDSGWYLPDFWLPNTTVHGISGCWVEVKPDGVSQCEKLAALCEQANCYGLLVSGAPAPLGKLKWPSNLSECPPRTDDGWGMHFPEGMDENWTILKCGDCGRTKFAYWTNSETFWCDHCQCAWMRADHFGLLMAYSAARSARFEHGETA